MQCFGPLGPKPQAGKIGQTGGSFAVEVDTAGGDLTFRVTVPPPVGASEPEAPAGV